MKKIARSVLILFLILLCVECGARIFETETCDRDDYPKRTWWIYSKELGWEFKPHFKGFIYGAYRSVGENGLSIMDIQEAPDNKRTIVALGASDIFGNHVSEHKTCIKLLEKLLPGTRTINMGVPGYSSCQGYKLLVNTVPRFRPALIIVSFNFNDRRYVLKKNQRDSEAAFRRLYYNEKIYHMVSRLMLIRISSRLMPRFQLQDRNDRNDSNVSNVNLGEVYARVPPDKYRENIVKIAEFSRAHKIPTIFLLTGDHPTYTRKLREGVRYLENSEYDLAIENLTQAVRLNNFFSDIARIYLARAYERKGWLKKAEAALISRRRFISLHGGFPIYSDTEYREIMRAVANQYEIKIVDAGSVLSQEDAHVDFAHFSEKGHEKIAHLLSEAIEALLSRK